MSYRSRQGLQDQLLGRQLAVTFSCIAWLIIAAATLVGIGFCLYYTMHGYGMLPAVPEVAAAARRTLVASLILTSSALAITVMLYFYLKQHIPQNLKLMDDLANQISKP